MIFLRLPRSRNLNFKKAHQLQMSLRENGEKLQRLLVSYLVMKCSHFLGCTAQQREAPEAPWKLARGNAC